MSNKYNFNGISVVIPVYNSAKYLKDCLDSISNQNYEDFEVIVVNDGSSDSSKTIVEDHCKKDSRFKLINQENHGLSYARNVGILNSIKDYVCFVDSDDQVSDDYLSVFAENLRKYDADIVTSLFAEFNGNKITKDKLTIDIVDGKTAFSRILRNQNISYFAMGKCIKTSLMLKHLFPEGKIYEDAYTIPQLLYSAKKVCITDAPTYLYIRREGSVTMSKFAKRDLDCIEAHLHNYNFALENAKNDIEVAQSRLIWSKMYVLDRMIMANDYNYYNDVRLSLLKDYQVSIKNSYLTKFRRIGLFLVKNCNSLFKIYTKIIYKHKKYW